MKTIVTILCFVLCTGCSHLPARITSGGTSIVGVADAGKPATLNKDEAKTTIGIPADTKVTVTVTDPIPATDKQDYIPRKTTTEWTFLKPTTFEQVASTLVANTGTVDVSIAKHKIDVASSLPLLYAAIGSALGAAVFIFLKYPTPALACGAAAVIFFLAWKVSGLPDWFWALGACAIVGGAALYFGHERGLFTPVPPKT